MLLPLPERVCSPLLRRLGSRGLAALLVLLAMPVAADARVETLRWRHPDPAAVDAFRVYTRAAGSPYGAPVYQGLPSADADGVFAWVLSVPDDATVVVAVTAVSGSFESDRSNEKELPGLGAGGGGSLDPTRPSVRINAGGGAYTDGADRIWEPDSSYVNGGVAALDSGIEITGTADPELFHSTRYTTDPASRLVYEVPLVAGTYAVRIHSVETWPDMQVGQRRFGIELEGASVAQGVDILAETGRVGAVLTQAFEAAVSDGALTIDFVPDVLYPTVGAIEVERIALEDPPPTTDGGTSGGSGTTGDGTGTTGGTAGDGSGTSGGTSGSGGATGGSSEGGDPAIGAPGKPVLIR
jgi:hypothetical protein